MCDRDKHCRDREGDGVFLNIKIPPTKKRGREEERMSGREQPGNPFLKPCRVHNYFFRCSLIVFVLSGL